MKIALIRQKYTPFGGAERFVERALAALQRDGVELTLITRNWSAAPQPDQQVKSVICDPPYLGRTWRDAGFARAACAAVAKGGFDLVQSHERIVCCDVYRAGDGLHRVWLAQRRRVLGAGARCWLKISPFHRQLLAAEEQLFRSDRLRAVICISQLVKREIQEHFDLPDERLHVIYNGVDRQVFHPGLKRERAAVRARHGVPEDAPLFLFVGSGFERKGLARALRALPPGAWLMVVGRDRHADRYRTLARRLGIERRVAFAGPQTDVGPYYGAADAFVFPTLYEPFGNVVLEAMASGLPVVTSTTCGGGELVEAGRNGFVCDALDVDGLRDALEQLGAPGRAAALGAAAARTAAAFTPEAMANQMIDLYRHLLPRPT